MHKNANPCDTKDPFWHQILQKAQASVLEARSMICTHPQQVMHFVPHGLVLTGLEISPADSDHKAHR